MAHDSKASVLVAVFSNIVVTIAKFVGFAVTGSSALLSEGIHSVADTANQALLLVGLSRSRRPADGEHPFGYGRERFFWGLVSALGIFFVGAGVTFMHGVEGLADPHPVEYGVVTWVVLGIALVFEGGALSVAVKSTILAARADRTSFYRYVVDGRDPTVLAVILEDGAAVFGVVLVSICIALAELTGNPAWDAIASILVAMLLATVALFLIAKNRGFLLTKAIDEDVEARVKAVIESHDIVEKMSNFKGTVVSLGDYRIAADIDFDGRRIAARVVDGATLRAARTAAGGDDAALERWLGEFAERVVERLGEEVDKLEQHVREAVPEAHHIDLEQD